MTDTHQQAEDLAVTDDGDSVDPDLFINWVASHPNNIMGLELSEHLWECAQATKAWGTKSKLTIEITITDGGNQFGNLDIIHKATSVPARPKPTPHAFFLTEDGLSRYGPNQPQLPGTEDK